MSTADEAPSASSPSAKDFVSTVLVAHEDVIEACAKDHKLAASAGDAEAEDLLIGRVKTHQKAVSFPNS
jgi:DNA-binding ferritin-like protein